MNKWGFCLYMVLFTLGTTASYLATGPESKVIVGDRHMTGKQLEAIASRIGRARPIEPDGFVTVTARGNLASVRRRFHEQGVEFVLPFDSREVDPNSLPSVESHIAYLEARYDLADLRAEKGEREGVDFYEALEFYLQRRVEADGELDPERWLRGAQHREQMPQWRPGIKRAMGPKGLWEHIGPFGLDTPYRTYYGVPPLSGRKTGMAYAPSDPNIIYSVGGGGGVFKSADGGATWAAKSDAWPFLQSYCVAVDPVDPNVVYAGTGDYQQGSYAFGLMKSTDGGNNWTNYGAAQFGVGVITKLVIDPADHNVILASVARGGAARGIWRSTNAGASWTQVLAPGLSMQDLDISASDGSGRTWWSVGGPGVVGGYVYKSNDGITWSPVTSPSGATENAMEVACSKVDRGTVYILATGAEQIYKTTNGGTNWNSIKNNFPSDNGAGDNYDWSQKTYDYHISTTRNGATDIVIVGLISVAASFNGGTTWVDLGLTFKNNAKTHNDQHCFANHPTDPNKILIGNDGGLFQCVLDPANSVGAFTPLNAGISDEMFYEIALHPTDDTIVMGGTQDNATPASRGNLSAWDNLYAGDGCWCAFDLNNPGIHYTSSQGLSVFRYDTANDGSPTGISPNWSAAFVAPLIVAGNGSELFAATAQNLQKYNGAGTSWTQSGQVLTAGTVTFLAAAPSNRSIIYSGANDGQVWRTPDEGGTFKRVDAGLPDTGVGGIVVSDTNPNDILVSVGNAGGLYRCTDTTAVTPVWTSISGSGGTALPAVPVNTMAFDPIFPTTIYAGTDLGAFISTDNGATWANMNVAGLPNVMISDLKINAAHTYLVAGTYGRGMWRVKLQQPTFAISGWVKQNGAAVPGATVKLMQGATLIDTATPDGNGDYSFAAEAGSYTLVPAHNDKTFFPVTRDVTVPPAIGSQNFTAGNIGPISMTFQYPVVYSDQSRQGTLNLNVVTPINRDITMSDNSFKLTSPVKVTVLAGQRSANFFVYGVTVVTDTLVTVTATRDGLTASQTITVRSKPVLNSMTLTKSSTKGGYGVSGTITIDKPAVGPMGLYLTSSDTGLATITPNPTAFYNGASSKGFYCKTFPVASTQVVTFTGTFYGSTKTVNLTLTP